MEQNIWKKNGLELELEVKKAVQKFLKPNYVNKFIWENQCFVNGVGPTQFEHYLEKKCHLFGIQWDHKTKAKTEVDMEKDRFEQVFGDKSAENCRYIPYDGKILVWKYYPPLLHLRYSSNCRKLFFSFIVRGKDPQGDVIAT